MDHFEAIANERLAADIGIEAHEHPEHAIAALDTDWRSGAGPEALRHDE